MTLSCYLNGMIRHPTPGVQGAILANWAKPRNVNIFMEEIQLQETGQTPPPPTLSLKIHTFVDIKPLHISLVVETFNVLCN